MNKKIYYQRFFKKSNFKIQNNLSWSFNFFKTIFLALAFYCFFITTFKIIFALLAFVLIILLIKVYKYIFMSILIFLIAYLINDLQKPILLDDFINGKFQVSSLSTRGPIFLINGTKILLHTSKIFNIGDLISVKGQIINFGNETINLPKGTINYLISLNVQNIIQNGEINLIKSHQSLYTIFKNYLNDFPLLLWFFLGVKVYKYLPIYKIMNLLNLTHLFVMSGYHITLVTKLLQKILAWFKLNCFFKNIMILIILWSLSYILDFNASILRATLIASLKIISKQFLKQKYHVLDFWSMTFLIMFLLWPYQIFAVNFILTFMSSLTLYVMTDIFIKKQTNKLSYKKSKFQHSFVLFFPAISIYLITLPILIYLNGYWNLFGIFYNLFFSPFVLVYQLLAIILIWSPTSINVLTLLLLTWCKKLAQYSLNLDVIFLNVTTLMLIYTLIFKSFLLIKHFDASIFFIY